MLNAPRPRVGARHARALRRLTFPIALLAGLFASSPAAEAACTGCAKPSFGPNALAFPTDGVRAAGDFNGDGISDVATARFGQWANTLGTIRVSLGSAGGTMLLASSTDVPDTYDLAIATGDFDGDGRLDLVVVKRQVDGQNLTGHVLFLRGDGAGGFAPALSVASGFIPGPFAVLDVDGDGRLDLAVGSLDEVLVFRGRGDGTFQAPTAIPYSGWIAAIVVGDVDSDGRPDLVVSNTTRMSVLRNTPGGLVTSFESFDAPTSSREFALADVDGDGALDLVIGVRGLGVLYGLGDGTFESPVWTGSGSGVTGITAGDFNADARTDVVASGGTTSAVFLSDAFGFLQEAEPIRPVGADTVGDFDGDGRLDLAGPGVLYLGNGDGTFTTARYLPTGYAAALTVVDVNKDGKPDLAWMSPNTAFGTMLGDGSGGFGTAVMTSFPVPYFNGVFADVTGDGIPDAVVTASAVPPTALYVLPGDGSGKFGASIVTTFGSFQQIRPPVVADFDGDGHPDVAFVLDGGLVVLFGDGTGHFPRSQPPRIVPFGDLSVSDLNGDGKPDLVIASPGGDVGDRLMTLINDGTGRFSTVVDLALSPSVYAPSIRLIDADGDGKPDLLATSYGVVTFRKGDGAGGFGPAVDTPVPEAWSLVAADFDGDGVLDLLTGFDSMRILKGRGDGTYDVVGSIPFPAGARLASDVTGDGRPDVIGMDYNNTWLVPNTTCVPRRLQLDASPLSCGSAGVPFPTQPTIRVFDDAGNPLLCETGTVVASLAPGGTAGANLGGTTSVPLVSGVAQFTDLAIDKAGGGYRVRFDLAATRPTATPLFSQSLPAPSISGPTQTCSGSTARFEGPAADGWTWSLDGAVVGTARILTLPAIPTGAHALALAIRAAACSSSASAALTVSAALSAPSASSNSPVPFGGTLQLNATAIPGATYRWAGPNGFSSTARNPAITFAKDVNGGRYTVVATVGTCDSAPATTDVVVVPPACTGCPRPSFSPAVRAVPVPAGFQGLALADFDGDGIVDVVAATSGSNGTVSFLKGDGRGAFASALTSQTQAGDASLLAAADLDGNGLPDLVTGSDGIWVSLQTSPGHFGKAERFPIGYPVTALAIADVNDDGFPDILATQSGGGGFGMPYNPGRVAVLIGNGVGGFGSPSYLPVEIQPSALVVRDLNGDGKADLIVANQLSETISVFFGDGAGGFTLQTTLAVSGPPVALAMGDVTGDAIADLVVGLGSPSPAAVIFQAAASGSLAFVRSLPVALDTKLALADLNGDGREDLLTLAGGIVHVRLGQGSALFSAPESYPAAGTATSFLVADFNGDGRADVVVGTGLRVLLLAGDGNGGLPLLPSLGPFAGAPTGLKAIDLNADGRPDLVVAVPWPYPPALGVYLAGAAGFTLAATLRPPGSYLMDSFSTGDVDGDGIPDVIELDRTGSFFVFRGLGNGLFAAPVRTDVGRGFRFLGAGDIDGDGRTDLLIGPDYTFGGATTAWFGNGASGFGSPVDLPTAIWNTTVAIGDLNGDGKGDVIARDDNSQALLVYLWNGTSFDAAIKTPIDATPVSLAVGDFDGDGKKDLVVAISPQYAGSSPGLRFLSGDGAGHFAAPVTFGARDVFSNLVVSDFNGDGALDAAAISNAGTVAVYMGDGHGAFSNSGDFTGGGVGFGLAAADLDGDGKQDLAFLRTNPSDVAFLFNTNCVPSRLGVTSNPACALAGQTFSLDVGVFDDGGNVVSCGAADVGARLVAGTGAAGAILSGTATVTAASGLAHFGDLAVDRDGRRYRIELSHPLAASARTAPFSVGAVPSPTITGPPQLCAGTSVWTAPSGYDTYAWTVDGAPVSSARRVTPSFLSAGNHTLGLTATRDRCPAQANVVISTHRPRSRLSPRTTATRRAARS
ncbi:MAG: VCBS repeat-containing protein [Acidobacteria bacterium]|nr:VCBS repeat-containing protein [Acidobacteriota bacterium]